jgi:hypothetical protein
MQKIEKNEKLLHQLDRNSIKFSLLPLSFK